MSKEQDVILTVIETDPTQDIVLTAVEPEPTQLITTNEGIVHLPDATRTRKGVVKVGSGLNIESGEISLDESYIKVNEIHLNNNLVTPDEKKRVFLEVDKTTVGLSNVDNTSDANKPVSTATQTELNKKLDKQQSPALVDKYLHVSADGTIDFVPGVGGLIDVVKRNGVALEITDRAVDVEVPVKTSELVNDGSDGEHPFITTGDIINNVTSTATDKPLSANMGYELKQQIDNVATIGRYLSQWDCTTGLPATNPTTLPYEYHRGDYYRVGTVGDTGVTRYKPSGTQYTGVASTEVETETDIKPDDIYFYDGTVWILQKVIVRDVSFGGIIGNPYDNTALSNALDSKQDYINDLSTIRDNASAGKTASDTIATYGDVVTHNANEFVDTTTNQSIGGTKTFTSRPNVNSTNVALVDELPTKVSDLQNDSEYVTESGLTQKDYATNTAVSTNYVKNSDYQEFTINVNTAMTELSDSVDLINSKIPDGASPSNKLADKNFVNSSINNIAAFYITADAAGNAFETVAQLTSATIFYSGGVERTPTRNDYCIVRTDENHDNATTRYYYQNQWEFQYIVNETALTADQLEALNSGITSGKVTQISTNKTNIEKEVTDRQNADSTLQSSITANANSITSLQQNKADKTEIPTNADFTLAGLSEKSYNSLTDKPIIPEGVQLYGTTGQNTDGAMTQKATTDELDKKLDASKGVTIDTEQTISGKKTFNEDIVIKTGKGITSTEGYGLFGFYGVQGAETLSVGNVGRPLKLNSQERPKVYNGIGASDYNNMAFLSDITTALETAKAQWLLDMNPIGTIIENNTGTNPSTYIGGTWTLYGQGRVTVCIDSTDSDFGGSTGSTGTQTSTLTINQYDSGFVTLPASKGQIDYVTISYNNQSYTVTKDQATTYYEFASGCFITINTNSVNIDNDSADATFGLTIHHIPIEAQGAGQTGGSKELQSHTHSATFTGKEITGQHSPIPEGKSTAWANGCFSVPASATKFGGIYQNATGDGRPVTFKATPEGTINIGNAGNGNSGNLQPYIVVYRWIRTA